MQSYYKILRRSDLKSPRNYSIFICTDVNIQMITNHPHISILISSICMNTNTGYQCITRAVNITRKSRLILLCSVVIHCIQRYTRMHQYIKYRKERPPYDFHYIFYMRISSTRKQESPQYDFHYIFYMRISLTCKHILSHPSQKHHKYLKHENAT